MEAPHSWLDPETVYWRQVEDWSSASSLSLAIEVGTCRVPRIQPLVRFICIRTKHPTPSSIQVTVLHNLSSGTPLNSLGNPRRARYFRLDSISRHAMGDQHHSTTP